MGDSNSKEKEDLGELHMTDVTFLWKIENFSQITLSKSMKSPTFAVSTLSCHLELLKGSYSTISLHGNDSSTHQVKLLCKICVIDKEGHERHANIKKVVIGKENDDEVMLKLHRPSSEKQKNSILPGDTMIVKLEVTVLGNTEYTEIPSK